MQHGNTHDTHSYQGTRNEKNHPLGHSREENEDDEEIMALQRQRMDIRNKISELRSLSDAVYPQPAIAHSVVEIDHSIPWYLRSYHVLPTDIHQELRPEDTEYERLAKESRDMHEYYMNLLQIVEQKLEFHRWRTKGEKHMDAGAQAPLGGVSYIWEDSSDDNRYMKSVVAPVPVHLSRMVGREQHESATFLDSNLNRGHISQEGKRVQDTGEQTNVYQQRRSYKDILEALRYEETLLARRRCELEYERTRSATGRWWEMRDSRFSGEISRVNKFQYNTTGYRKTRYITKQGKNLYRSYAL